MRFLAAPSAGECLHRMYELADFTDPRTWNDAIGRALHEEPQIPNFGDPGRGPQLKPGMVFAIEPMVNLGGPATKTLPDRWTIVTLDGSLSAHFEHTVAITENGLVGYEEILERDLAVPTDHGLVEGVDVSTHYQAGSVRRRQEHGRSAALPGLAIFLAVLGFNLLGDGLRDALDPKLKR